MAKFGLYHVLAGSAALLVPLSTFAADGASGTVRFRGSIVAPAECSVSVAGAANGPRGQLRCPQRGAAPKAYPQVRMTPVLLQPDAKGVRARGYIATIVYF